MKIACLGSQGRGKLRSTWLSTPLSLQHATGGAWRTCSLARTTQAFYHMHNKSTVAILYHCTFTSCPSTQMPVETITLLLVLQHTRSVFLLVCSHVTRAQRHSQEGTVSQHRGKLIATSTPSVIHASTATRAEQSVAQATYLFITSAPQLRHSAGLAQLINQPWHCTRRRKSN